MTIERNIAFLGAGNMAAALIDGLIAAGTCKPSRITATDVRPERLEELVQRHGIRTTASNPDAVAEADVVILAVKPQVLSVVLDGIGGSLRPETLVVSVAAGVPAAVIEKHLADGTRVVRTMPNTPALVHAGATGIAPGARATKDDLEVVEQLFGSVGRTVTVNEQLLDAVTGLSGSGPAYVFVMIEALSDAGVKMGLPRDAAIGMAAQTVYGAAKLVLESGEHPARLKDRVTSPAGTTIAGVHALEEGGLRATMFRAVEAATRRADELGKKASGG
ncbi:MAG: pyrroline-5-carboxylate reductase [Myxococcota bacterium]